MSTAHAIAGLCTTQCLILVALPSILKGLKVFSVLLTVVIIESYNRQFLIHVESVGIKDQQGRGQKGTYVLEIQIYVYNIKIQNYLQCLLLIALLNIPIGCVRE